MKDTSKQAFPTRSIYVEDVGSDQNGMTFREYAAVAAMQGVFGK